MGQFDNFISLAEDSVNLSDARIENGKNILPFGISFLDDALRGIFSGDFILIGAGSGGGKSETAWHIAIQNAFLGKKVLLFALEAEKHEVAQRMQYKLYAKKYFADPERQYCYFNYSDFFIGRLETVIEKYKAEVESEIKLTSANLFIRYSFEDYTIENFELDVENYSDFDLIVLDHLHYLDFDDVQENKAYKRIVKKIRSISQNHKKPVVLVSQLRKEGSFKRESIMPDLADFHGSSDIYKLVTKAIMLAPASSIGGLSAPSNSRHPTLIKAVKCRLDGSLKEYVGAIGYDFKRNEYEENYVVGRLSKENKSEVFIKELDPPQWAVRHKHGVK